MRRVGLMTVFAETTQYEAGFDVHWQKHVVPHLMQYKQLYKRYERLGYLVTIIAILAGILAWFIWDSAIQYSSENGKSIFALIVIFGEIGLLLGGWWPLYKLADDPLDWVKQAIDAHFAPYFSPDENDGFAALQAAHLRDEGLTHTGNITISEHHSGAYRDCRIRFYTAMHTVKEVTSSNNSLEEKLTNTRQHALNFLIFSLSVPFDFPGETRIETDKGSILNKLRSKTSGFSQYKVPDKAFEKAFEVFTNDTKGASQLISPAFVDSMMAIKQFYKKRKGGKLSCQFKDKHFTLTVRDGGHFMNVGTGHFAPSQVEGLARTLIQRFGTILQLVDMLHGDKPAS